MESTTVDPAGELTKEVLRQVKRDFGDVLCPITLHEPVPELLAASWSALRETLVSGDVDRATKETVASIVSRANRCPYCVDAHVVMLEAAGKHEVTRAIERGDYASIPYPHLRAVALWAAATGKRGSAELVAPPFGEAEAPEMKGTAVYFHYINRMVSVFCEESPFVTTAKLLRPSFKRFGARRFKNAVLGRHSAGESLNLVRTASLPADLAWAAGSEPVAAAWSALSAAVEQAGERTLSRIARERVALAISAWNGEDMPLAASWIDEALDGVDSDSTGAARLALLAALAPHRVAAPVALSDATVAAAAWGAFSAARRVGAWLGE